MDDRQLLLPVHCLVLLTSLFAGCGKSSSLPPPSASSATSVTFNKQIAPILFEHCAPCHRPGQSAPFSLLTYASARKHASEIVDSVRRRYMPPWLPEPGYGEFVDERGLSSKEIGLIQAWVAQGSIEGNPGDLPSPPKFREGWQLGEPDLVVQMPQAYQLAGEGKDLYRNFVIPMQTGQTRFVQALEFHPNNKSVHHVRILLDPTQQSRRLEGQDGQPGFGGMNVPAKFPPGHMLTWTPGRTPAREPEGMAWILEPNTDIVLQIHMQRTGKLELIQPQIGLFFTNQPPSKSPVRIGLLSELIDIPAGDSEYVVERDFELPADVDVLAVLPHLHYLGKEIQGYARLPDGSRQSLLFIKSWDFNWQSEYRYRKPVFLPRGSVISLHYTYDNSARNPRNPSQPPRRVTYGPQSVDEMGELWLQLLPRKEEDAAALQAAHRLVSTRETAAYYEKQLLTDPTNAAVHLAFGKALGPLGRIEEASQHLQTAISLEPSLFEVHYYLAMTWFSQQRWADAKAEFETTLRLNQRYFHAEDGLGLVALQAGDLGDAERHFNNALRLNPNDAVARGHLDELSKPK
jgi:Flp pilus assembly protein TadD